MQIAREEGFNAVGHVGPHALYAALDHRDRAAAIRDELFDDADCVFAALLDLREDLWDESGERFDEGGEGVDVLRYFVYYGFA